MPEISGSVACTIISKNYLSYARVLARSFKEQHAATPFIVLLCDTIDDCFNPLDEAFEIVLIDQLSIPDISTAAFQYTITELNTFVKPYFLEYLITNRGYQMSMYFDPDVFIYQSVLPLFTALESCSITLTPHLTRPLPDDGKLPNEITILQSGTYNLGFIGIRNTPTTRRFLEWWKTRLRNGCRLAISNGMHVDQKWIDLVPGIFGDVHIFREQGLNVAYWNIPTLELTAEDGAPFVDGAPAVFMHFSGIDPSAPDRISKHDTRLTRENLGTAFVLFREYMKRLVEADYFTTRRWAYAFGHFTNGVEIPPRARQIYLELDDRKGDFGNPFDADCPESYFRWLVEAVDEGGDTSPGLPRILYDIYQSRDDLGHLYPDPFGKDHGAFKRWAEEYGQYHYQLAPVFLEAQSRPLSSGGVTSPAGRAERGLGVNAFGCFASAYGDGQTARSLVQALGAAKIPAIVSDPRRFIDDLISPQQEIVYDAPYPVNLVVLGEGDRDWYGSARGRGYLAQRYNIFYLAGNPARVLEDVVAVRGLADEMWVGSALLRDALGELVTTPVHIVPRPLPEPNPVPTWSRHDVGIPDNAFVFLHSLDSGSTLEPRLSLAVIHAFKLAFPAEERVLLLIDPRGEDVRSLFDDDVRAPIDGEGVRIADSSSSSNRALRILQLCDCYISLHPEDVLGQAIANAMLLGKPVIATAYSGDMEFMNPQNSYLVRSSPAVRRKEFGVAGWGSRIAEPDIAHAAAQMRDVYAHAAEAQRVGGQARRDARARFSAASVGLVMRERLIEIAGQLRRIGL